MPELAVHHLSRLNVIPDCEFCKRLTINMDAQDNQDGTLLHDLQSLNCTILIIIDLLWFIRVQFPHNFPLFEKESVRPSRTLSDVTVRSRCGLGLLRVCPLCQPSNRRSVPLPPPSDWGQSAEMKPVQSERYGRFASRVEGFRGWRALSAGLTWGGGGSLYVGGSAATPTQCGLIATGRMPTDWYSTP